MLHQLLDRLPRKDVVARLGAGIPPVLKHGPLPRALWAVTRRSGAQTLTTNFGITSRYAIETPQWAGQTVLFGAPSQYRGERGALRLAATLAPQCSAFVDVGAHLGYFLFYLRHVLGPELPLYYFEAHPGLAETLRENLTRNGIGNVRGFAEAIGDHEGEATFHIDDDDVSSSSLESFFAAKHRTHAVTVPMTTFARFARERMLTNLCVKVDVEDAEFQFLRGAEDAFTRVRYLIMEVLGPAERRGFHREMITRGWRAYYIDDLVLRHSPDGQFTYVPPEYNWLYCRESPTELRYTLHRSGLSVSTG